MIPLIAGLGMVLFVALFIFALFRGSKQYQEERGKLLQDFAARHDFSMSEQDIFGLGRRIKEFGAIGYAKNPIVNIVNARLPNGTTLYLFDQVKIGRTSGIFTVCLLVGTSDYGVDVVVNEVESRLAARMSRSMGGSRSSLSPVKFEDPDFDDRYVVFTSRPAVDAGKITPDFRRYLMTRAGSLPVPMVVCIRKNMLAVYNSGMHAKSLDSLEHLETLYDTALGLEAVLMNRES